MVANATMFSHLLPGCSCGSKHLLLLYILCIVNLVHAFLCNVCNAVINVCNAWYLIPSVRTNCRKFTVGYAGPILWNSFPQKLRQLPSEVIFKKKLKSILLATY